MDHRALTDCFTPRTPIDSFNSKSQYIQTYLEYKRIEKIVKHGERKKRRQTYGEHGDLQFISILKEFNSRSRPDTPQSPNLNPQSPNLQRLSPWIAKIEQPIPSSAVLQCRDMIRKSAGIKDREKFSIYDPRDPRSESQKSRASSRMRSSRRTNTSARNTETATAYHDVDNEDERHCWSVDPPTPRMEINIENIRRPKTAPCIESRCHLTPTKPHDNDENPVSNLNLKPSVNFPRFPGDRGSSNRKSSNASAENRPREVSADSYDARRQSIVHDLKRHKKKNTMSYAKPRYGDRRKYSGIVDETEWSSDIPQKFLERITSKEQKAKKLLEELYNDKIYLEHFSRETQQLRTGGLEMKLQRMAKNGVGFLQQCAYFWDTYNKLIRDTENQGERNDDAFLTLTHPVSPRPGTRMSSARTHTRLNTPIT